MKTKKTTVSKKAKPVRKKKKVVKKSIKKKSTVKKAKKTSIRKPKESFVYVDVRCVEATIFGIKAAFSDGSIGIGPDIKNAIQIIKTTEVGKNKFKNASDVLVSMVPFWIKRKQNFTFDNSENKKIIEMPTVGHEIFLRDDNSISEKITSNDKRFWESIQKSWTKFKEGKILRKCKIVEVSPEKYEFYI